MSAGRPAKPTELHKLDGTYRPDRHSNGVAADTQLLAPPDHLSGLALAEWLRVASELHEVNLTTALDTTLLEQYCVMYAQWRGMVAEVDKHGAVQETQTGYSQQTGYFTVAVKLAKEIRDIAKEFGLTPSARSRMRINREEQSEQDDIATALSKLSDAECQSDKK